MPRPPSSRGLTLAKKPNFYQVVQAAVNDIADNGFDSEARLEKWKKKILAAAESALPSPTQLDKMLRDSLIAIYGKLVDKGGLETIHPGVSKYTIEKLRPHLRAELDKRIAASASLIKLNRTKAIAATMARFEGWSTSIPAGGTSQANKASTKASIKRAMQSLPFEERRLLTDQGHKLTASINDVVARDGGAIAVVWHSNWRQKNYNYREDHKDRDEKCYAIRDNWAIKKGLMKAGPVGFYDDITKVAEEPFCRCYAKYIYNPRSLPDYMLTAKGKAALADARAALAS